MFGPFPISDILHSIGEFISLTWWLWAFFVLLPLCASTLRAWRQSVFLQRSEGKYTLLELRMPLEVKKSPEAMEQVLANIHALSNAPAYAFAEYWEGEVTLPHSLELVSFSGEVHFYLRTTTKFKELVKAAIFSYYPDVEVVEVNDYVERIPSSLAEVYAYNYNVWAAEMALAREDAYPIKTYHKFESPDEDKQFDPIATFLEVLGKLRQGEVVGFQFVIAPIDGWHKKWAGLIEKLKNPSSAASVRAGETEMKFVSRTPGETEILEEVEKNLSKPGFRTLIRYIYFAPKEIFEESFARKGLAGIFNQYTALNLNSFVRNFGMSTSTLVWFFPFAFPKWRTEFRKQRMLSLYRHRSLPPESFMGKLVSSYFFNLNFASKTFVLNTESLATVFHPPTYRTLTAPHVRRMESKKAGPPAGLAIFGDEKEIERFL